MERLHIILVVGLPGSGKTYWAQARAAQTEIPTYVLDDPRTPEDLTPAFAWLNQLPAGDHPAELIVCDPNACDPEVLKRARTFWRAYGHVQAVFFENDPTHALHNVHLRQERGDARAVEGAIRMWSRMYTPVLETGDVLLKVWQDPQPSANLENASWTSIP